VTTTKKSKATKLLARGPKLRGKSPGNLEL
jgi:hypothetical protein